MYDDLANLLNAIAFESDEILETKKLQKNLMEDSKKLEYCYIFSKFLVDNNNLINYGIKDKLNSMQQNIKIIDTRIENLNLKIENDINEFTEKKNNKTLC